MMMMIQRHLQTTCCISFVETFIAATSSSWRMIDTIGAINESSGDHHHHCRSIHHHITHPYIRSNRSYRYSSSSSKICMTTKSNDEPSDSGRRRRRRRSWMTNQPYQNIQGNRFVRSFTSWWRGGGSNSKSSSNTGSDSSDSSHKSSSSTHRANVDVSKKPRDSSSSYPMYLLRRYNEYPVSTCSIQGYRHHMEDEYMIHTSTSTKNPMPDTSNSHNNSITGTYSTIHRSVRNYDMISTSNTEDKIIHEEYGIIGCFDGHGGNAVSRYLRQNLFKNIQAALFMIQMTKPQQPPPQQQEEQQQSSSSPADDDDTQSKVKDQHQQVNEQLEDVTTHDDYTSHPDETIEAKLQSQQEEEDSIHDNDEKKKNNDQNQQFICHEDNEIKYEQFLTNYLPDSIVDSMIAATTPDTSKPTVNTVEDYISALEVALDKVDREVLKVKHWSQQGSTAIVCWIHTEPIEDYELKQKDYTDQRSNKSKRKELKQQKRQPHPIHRTIITANIGDSRAILCRNGTAIALSRDHKPNDPIERKRIEQLGGTVVWSGGVDRMKEPIPGMGCYRVNNALAISRAIGDRMERPIVTSDPDITVISILPEYDEFIVVATDGLWDVMSSNDTVAFIRALLHNTMDDGDTIDRDTIATYVVEEALRRGSFDNITVMIVWLQ